jgi:hypothetical protein
MMDFGGLTGPVVAGNGDCFQLSTLNCQLNDYGETGGWFESCTQGLKGMLVIWDGNRDARMIKNVWTISSDTLSRLPWLVRSPYRVVVFHGPVITNLGMSLALRCFQRLSLPHLATQPCH